jgi:glycosyltransferase involved in cell wall biosynthesis
VLVPFRDSKAIAKGVCELLDDPERMEKIRSDAYQYGPRDDLASRGPSLSGDFPTRQG